MIKTRIIKKDGMYQVQREYLGFFWWTGVRHLDGSPAEYPTVERAREGRDLYYQNYQKSSPIEHIETKVFK